MPRITRRYIERANRDQLKAYLNAQGLETYREESTPELREAALSRFDQDQPDEPEQGMYSYGGAQQ